MRCKRALILHASQTRASSNIIRAPAGVEGRIVKVTHEEIQRAAEKAEPKMTLIMKEVIKSI